MIRDIPDAFLLPLSELMASKRRAFDAPTAPGPIGVETVGSLPDIRGNRIQATINTHVGSHGEPEFLMRPSGGVAVLSNWRNPLALDEEESPEPVMPNRPLVAIVDDDESVRESLPDLLDLLGFSARAFQSPEEFLASDLIRETSCLILDISMPGMSGPQLQEELERLDAKIPIIFITGRVDESLRRRLLERGAVDCLLKPFSETALVEALRRALRLS